MVKSTTIDKWLSEFVRSIMEMKTMRDGATLPFVVDYMGFLCIAGFSEFEKQWSGVPANRQKALIHSELRKLERKLLVYKVEDVKGDYWFWRID